MLTSCLFSLGERRDSGFKKYYGRPFIIIIIILYFT